MLADEVPPSGWRRLSRVAQAANTLGKDFRGLPSRRNQTLPFAPLPATRGERWGNEPRSHGAAPSATGKIACVQIPAVGVARSVDFLATLHGLIERGERKDLQRSSFLSTLRSGHTNGIRSKRYERRRRQAVVTPVEGPGRPASQPVATVANGTAAKTARSREDRCRAALARGSSRRLSEDVAPGWRMCWVQHATQPQPMIPRRSGASVKLASRDRTARARAPSGPPRRGARAEPPWRGRG